VRKYESGKKTLHAAKGCDPSMMNAGEFRRQG
jgi:hypothetical protein